MVETDSVSSSAVIELNEAVKDYGNNKRIGPANLALKKEILWAFLAPTDQAKPLASG